MTPPLNGSDPLEAIYLLALFAIALAVGGVYELLVRRREARTRDWAAEGNARPTR